MRKLLDMGMEQIRKLLVEMGNGALEALESARKSLDGEFDGTVETASKLHILRNEILDIATELLVRYSPMAGDLRFIQSAIDVSYDLYRISRYAMEIERTMRIVKPDCLPELSKEGFEVTVKAVKTAVEAFSNLDEMSAGRLLELDEKVDELYLKSLENLREPRECSALDALILRHLERISDHAKEIGARVVYIKEGKRL
ncbi:phosphate signaling complex PhoU family protein [Thermococcus thioreducens]|uniref:PhoU family transcriptional regulator n=1 Tax=Thermococcus thioreducens TaxID=277988 RepID=A0A0Q2S692_9EURY|nr:phosphate uptake regulator PhoU [Thermococcus thioreducens]ASJ12216.1 PhoU family transcriptional regulator [Thermococcus thioreducens]KQH82955.1 PhoU family transcriptional regulator [Thermococcus thioreducens]SEV94737.1 phosphate transport system protein [Thermococcus thioreducens]